ncbi:MAG: hypothetical protein ACLR6X_01040 [Mediterraneibacter gnavus]
MSEYITTYTGKYFNPTQPNPDLISIQDIAHALSLICRGNGHVQTLLVSRAALYLLCKGSRSKRSVGPYGTCLSAS